MVLRSPNSGLTDTPTVGDSLYHFGFDHDSFDWKKEFGKTKVVICGGTNGRMKSYAEFLSEANKQTEKPKNLSKSERFVLYRVGAVLFISHGMGPPSLSIMLNETLKLLLWAGLGGKDVVFVRCGTSGGLGASRGTIIVAKNAISSTLEYKYETVQLGVLQKMPTRLDAELSKELVECATQAGIGAVNGDTMCTHDFYNEQARMNGFFCNFDADEATRFLHRAAENGVANIEMESTCFAAMTHRAGVRGAIVCVSLLDRLQGDVPPTDKGSVELHPMKAMLAYLRKHKIA